MTSSWPRCVTSQKTAGPHSRQRSVSCCASAWKRAGDERGDTVIASAATDPSAGLQIAAGIGAFLLYFVPSIIGAVRRVRGLGSVIVVNFFFGWTVIGWIVALAMAFRSTKPQVT